MLTSFATQPVFTAATIKALEEKTLAQAIDQDVLVKQAGITLAQQLQILWPQAQRVAIFCGSGNNGADGYSLALVLNRLGLDVTLVALGQERKGTESMHRMRAACVAKGLCFNSAESALEQADVVVDAMLGNGARASSLPEEYVSAIQRINAASLPVLAVDLPTGVHGDSGVVHEPAIKASYTVAFIGYRLGHCTGIAEFYCGQVILADLGVNIAQAPRQALRVMAQQDRFLPERSVHSHKGSQGHLLVVGGDNGMGGAALLAASAALHAGVGKITVLTRAEHISGFLARQPELMVVAVNQGDDISSWLSQADAIVLGPGLGRKAWGQCLFEHTLATDKPLLCDADGIYWYRQQDCSPRRASTVFTPHPGEAASLLGVNNSWVQQHRLSAVEKLVNKLAATVVLKGNGTLISRAQAEPLVLSCGNPGMAVAGMGDVLSGIIGALSCQGLTAEVAAFWGAWWHGYTADQLALRRGQVGLLPTDVISTLRESLFQ